MIPAQGRQALITAGWIGLPGGQLVRDRTSSLRETLHSSAASTVTNDAGDLAVGPASRHQLGDPLLGTGQRLRRRGAAPRRTDLAVACSTHAVTPSLPASASAVDGNPSVPAPARAAVRTGDQQRPDPARTASPPARFEAQAVALRQPGI